MSRASKSARDRPSLLGGNPSPELGSDTFICYGTTVKGNLSIEGDLRLEGRLEAEVKVTGRLVVGPKAEIKGDVQARVAQVSGKIYGNLRTAESVDLFKGSKLVGDVFARSFRIEDGAYFQGNCFMGEAWTEES
jgi:cytoskeletal protein CcmA (bactofilin family)